MKLISDAGPIIGLAKIGQIYLLKKLATEVLISPFVAKELYGKIGVESELIEQAAEDLGINKTGLVGLLILAKQSGYIDNVGSLLEQLRSAGYWLSDEILALARKMAQEES